MKLPPLIRWPGGQSREARRLEHVFPEHRNYVEPFVGGGAFFFHKELAPGKNAIGDTSDWLIDFYQKSRMGALRKCKSGVSYSKSNYERALKKSKPTPCDRVVLSAMGFAGQRGGFDESRKKSGTKTGTMLYKSKFAKLDEYEKKLRKSWLSTKSFEKTMRKHDSKDTWHLLDPPWPNVASTQKYDGKLTVTPEEVAKVGESMKGTVWVLYNETPEVKKAFKKSKGWHIYRLDTKVMHPRKGMQKYRKVLITNKKLKATAKGTTKLQGLSLADSPKHSRNVKIASMIAGALVGIFVEAKLQSDPPDIDTIVARTIKGGAIGFFSSEIINATVLGLDKWIRSRRT